MSVAAAEYAQRIEQLQTSQSRDQRSERAFGIAKLIVAALTVASAVLIFHRFTLAWIPAALIVVFIVLAIHHERLLQAIRTRSRVVRFYHRGLTRLEDRWQRDGETGARYLDTSHPYSRDLDIFGDASLFQFLSVARTHAGEDTLARWLQKPADRQEIAARQAAVRELRSRLDFRERLSTAGETVRKGVHPDALARWGVSDPILTSISRRILTAILPLLWILSIVAWIVWRVPEWFVLNTLLNFAYAHILLPRSEEAAAAIEHSADDLLILGEVMTLLEREAFPPGRLADLQASLQANRTAPSQAVRKLARIVRPLEGRHSLIAHPLDLVTFWSAQLVFAAERWQRRFGPSIETWLQAVGELEALSSLATFSYEHPDYAFPQVSEGPPRFNATRLAHPLLPIANAVENDVQLDEQNSAMILSGPNMAGKSTFIRAIGVNAVLAQCGAPVRAHSLLLSPLQVAASICILDSLSGGISRFYAEIHRVKLIVDLARENRPVLYLLDELLSGTNSHDRLIGTEFVLKSLAELNAIGIVSTHDLALTRIADEMAGAFNAHFADRLEGDRLIFDYKLHPGVVQTSNALQLMRAIGLRVQTSSADPPA